MHFQGIFTDTASNSRFVMNSSYSCNYLISKNKELFGKKEKEEEKEKKGFLSMPESRIWPWSDMVHLY